MPLLSRLFLRRCSSSGHVGVLQVFKLTVTSPPGAGEKLRMLRTASPETAAQSLAEAADAAAPVLLTERALRELVASPAVGDGLELPANSAPAAAIGDGCAAGGPARAHGGDALATAGDATALALAEHSAPLGDVLRAGAEPDPSWGEIRHATARELMDHAEETRPSDAQMRVLKAAADGTDVAELEAALRDCPAAELRAATLPPSGGSALHLAASSGALEMVQALLDAGCELHARAANGSTALHWAAGSGHAAVVRALLRLGASPTTRTSTWGSTVRGDNSGQTAAHWAAGSGHDDALGALLDADPHALLVRDERQLDVAAVATRDGHGATAWDLDALGRERVVCVRVTRAMAVQRPVHLHSDDA